MPALFSHLPAQVFFGRLTCGEALQLKAMHRAIKPVGTDDAKQPVRSHVCQLTQGCSETLCHAFQATQSTHVGQDKGRIGALVASSFEPAVLAAHLHNGLQQAILRPMVDEALTKVHQNTGVKALLIQRQGEGIFPIQASPHHLRSLAVREIFQRLQDGDQRQPPRCFCRSSPSGKQIGKVGILIDGAQRIAQMHS